MRKYYTEQTMESIARRVLDTYDERLYRGQPCAIPIEDLIERHGLTLEFQYLRKNGRILGKTVFDTGLEAVYDVEQGQYTLFPVKQYEQFQRDGNKLKVKPIDHGER